jgi:hypothetical protein
METERLIVYLVAAVFIVVIAYGIGSRAGKTILFLQDLIKHISEINRQEKP